MSTQTSPIPQPTHLPTDPERFTSPSPGAEPLEDFQLAEAEEQEIAELWAGDTGNQGA